MHVPAARPFSERSPHMPITSKLPRHLAICCRGRRGFRTAASARVGSGNTSNPSTFDVRGCHASRFQVNHSGPVHESLCACAMGCQACAKCTQLRTHILMRMRWRLPAAGLGLRSSARHGGHQACVRCLLLHSVQCETADAINSVSERMRHNPTCPWPGLALQPLPLAIARVPTMRLTTTACSCTITN